MPTPDGPNFFDGRRISVFCKGARLVKDRKTETRYWRLKLALTLRDADAYGAKGAILSNYQHIQVASNAVGRMELHGGHTARVTFFAIEDMKAPRLILLEECWVDNYALTVADEQTEFWLVLEHKNTDALHQFVRDYAFTRLWVEFLPRQREITEIVADIVRLASAPVKPEEPRVN